MAGKYILRTDHKPNINGEYGICLYFSVKKVPVKKSMGIFVHPDVWLGDDGKNSSFILGGKHGHPKADIYNKILARKKDEVEQIIEDLERNAGFQMTVPLMRSILNGTYKEDVKIRQGKIPLIDEVLLVNKTLYLKEKISYSVWHNVQNQMGLFKKFLQTKRKLENTPQRRLLCSELTVEIIEEYIEWRKERGNSNETINKSLTPIFKAVRKLMRKGWIGKDTGDEILDLYLPTKCKSLVDPLEGNIDYLTKHQVKKLIQLTGESKYDRTKELMDMFLFSIHCGGMRFSDVCTLRWIEVSMKEKMIRHLQVKNHTKRPVLLNLPINTECMKILKRWRGKFDNFVYGQLPDEFDLSDYKRLKILIHSRNKTMNQSLQCIGEKMELPFRLHFHIARHTFASWAINKGVDIKTISCLMGHSSTMVTEKVYAKLFPETLKEIVKDKLDFDLD